VWQPSRALLFDKDGTIIDFNLKWLNWCRIIAKYLSSEKFTCEEIESKMKVWGVNLKTEIVKSEGFLATGSKEQLEESLAAEIAFACKTVKEAKKQVREAMDYANQKTTNNKMVKAVPGANSCIKHCSEQGYHLAVVTTDDTEAAVNDLKIAGLDQYFDTILGCDKVPFCKPAPDLIFEVCRQMGVKPSQAAVIGDTTADMLMGKNAVVAFRIGVTSGVGSKKELLDTADLVLSGIDEMT